MVNTHSQVVYYYIKANTKCRVARVVSAKTDRIRPVKPWWPVISGQPMVSYNTEQLTAIINMVTTKSCKDFDKMDSNQKYFIY